ncbi:Sapep family Mn(2+)-dependent dipeptidase [Vibrio sp. 99-8-1]|uniref:Sapep family Mn(2+)-dependent dipeptidase n=1 Tax=Vibrio sp. 99-8-1 TaxID=2607602 RepID=UPI0014938A6F|nr:Sapep family Mn(2+)-dependent dipeptidase [Vibrio sp. 99-8-1]
MVMDEFTQLSQHYFEKNRDNIVNDISTLVAVASVREESTRCDLAPFGKPIRQAFDKLIAMASAMGFQVEDHNGYAIDISYGEGEQEIAILHHIDVVSAEDHSLWNTPPYQVVEKQGFIYGRGTTDNKGPLIASLYLLKLFKEQQLPLDKKIRIIVGGAEETTWECIEHYFKTQPQPDYAFSPDGDFPIVNGESGILYSSFSGQCSKPSEEALCRIISITSERDRTSTCHKLELILAGSMAEDVAKLFPNGVIDMHTLDNTVSVSLKTPWEKSRNPQNTSNCMDKMVNVLRGVEYLDHNAKNLISLLDDLFAASSNGSKLGLNHIDDEMGSTTCCVSAINMDQQTFSVDFDFRYPKGLTIESIRSQLQLLSKQYEVNWTEHQYLPLSYLSPESSLIRSMEKAYLDVMGVEAHCFSKRAASYARSLQNGVAFGPTFSGDKTNVHEPNERLRIESLKKAFSIYVKVLISL